MNWHVPESALKRISKELCPGASVFYVKYMPREGIAQGQFPTGEWLLLCAHSS